jgi:hypothetical protein
MVKLARPTAVKPEERSQGESLGGRRVAAEAAPLTETATSGAAASAPGGAVWKIGRRAGACGACARAFEEGGLVYSSIFLEDVPGAEAPAVRRVDRCGLCHPRRERQDHEFHWRTRFHAEPRKPRLDLVALAEVFRQLVARQDPRFVDFLYLVTLMMLRHRKLRVVKTRTDETRDYLCVAFPRTKNTLDVEVVDLNPERMEVLRRQLLALFEGGGLTNLALDGAEPAAEVPPAGEAAAPENGLGAAPAATAG